jgi:DNA-directed RNA polymerase subunit RPC12/RpoP
MAYFHFLHLFLVSRFNYFDSRMPCHPSPVVLLRRTICSMWICIRCHTEFAEFTTEAEPNIDSFGLHFMCPVCGRRNLLRSLGRDDEGFLRLEQVNELEQVR